MPTDDERREMARRLRERAGKRVLNLGELFWCIGCDDGDDAAAWNRLADLIEPFGHECVPGECPLNVCHDNDRIDRDALLALAGKLDKDAVNIISAARNAQFTGGGPRMEEAKHDAYEWRQIARSIRKALGVES